MELQSESVIIQSCSQRRKKNTCFSGKSQPADFRKTAYLLRFCQDILPIPSFPRWAFPEIGVPPNHPFLDGIIPYKPSSYWGTPMTVETPGSTLPNTAERIFSVWSMMLLTCSKLNCGMAIGGSPLRAGAGRTRCGTKGRALLRCQGQVSMGINMTHRKGLVIHGNALSG